MRPNQINIIKIKDNRARASKVFGRLSHSAPFPCWFSCYYNERCKMKYLNKEATKTMDILVSGLKSTDGHKKIDDAPGFMAVVVEEIGELNYLENEKTSPMYSVAHYYEQNGDLCCDPDMTFYRTSGGYYVPMTFEQQGGLPVYTRAIYQNEAGKWMVNQKAQADITTFANTWMRNIKEQQRLFPPKIERVA